MEANELRKGNLVILKDKIIVIIGVFDEVFWYKSDGNTFSANVEFLEPIPLTPELLQKLDFINREKDNFSFNDNMSLRIIGDEYDYNGLWIGQIEYVHHLQNLYFAHKGVELELTAP